MNQFTKKKYFIGVDISKDHLDLAIIKEDGYGVFRKSKTVLRVMAGSSPGLPKKS